MTRVALLRWDQLPSFVTWEIPNTAELLAEDEFARQGLESQGVEVESIKWNQPGVDWKRFDAAILRSTWDYIGAPEKFLQVLQQIESSGCRLFNSLEAVRWNIDKRYLFTLEQAGVPIVPTWLSSAVEPGQLADLWSGRPWQTAILKPTLSAAGANLYRVAADEIADILTYLKSSKPGLSYMIQPFMESVTAEGEWSFVFFNRQLSHVLLKRPAANDFRVQGIYGGTVEAVEPSTHDLQQAAAILKQLPFDLLYARLDLVRVAGQLAVMEVELIEPILSFDLVPEAVPRFVAALQSRLETPK